MMNLSLIWLRYKEPNYERQFKSPLNIKKFPVLAALGIITPILGMIQFSPYVISMGMSVVALGALFFVYNCLSKKSKDNSNQVI